MKKQELIHLHGLLAEVCNHYEQSTESKIDRQKYRDFGVRPTSIHKSKTDHKKAVFALTSGITSEIEEETENLVSATSD